MVICVTCPVYRIIQSLDSRPSVSLDNNPINYKHLTMMTVRGAASFTAAGLMLISVLGKPMNTHLEYRISDTVCDTPIVARTRSCCLIIILYLMQCSITTCSKLYIEIFPYLLMRSIPAQNLLVLVMRKRITVHACSYAVCCR